MLLVQHRGEGEGTGHRGEGDGTCARGFRTLELRFCRCPTTECQQIDSLGMRMHSSVVRGGTDFSHQVDGSESGLVESSFCARWGLVDTPAVHWQNASALCAD